MTLVRLAGFDYFSSVVAHRLHAFSLHCLGYAFCVAFGLFVLVCICILARHGVAFTTIIET
jgi:hypothetical protein